MNIAPFMPDEDKHFGVYLALDLRMCNRRLKAIYKQFKNPWLFNQMAY